MSAGGLVTGHLLAREDAPVESKAMWLLRNDYARWPAGRESGHGATGRRRLRPNRPAKTICRRSRGVVRCGSIGWAAVVQPRTGGRRTQSTDRRMGRSGAKLPSSGPCLRRRLVIPSVRRLISPCLLSPFWKTTNAESQPSARQHNNIWLFTNFAYSSRRVRVQARVA